jgi:hypothetical protein
MTTCIAPFERKLWRGSDTSYASGKGAWRAFAEGQY